MPTPATEFCCSLTLQRCDHPLLGKRQTVGMRPQTLRQEYLPLRVILGNDTLNHQTIEFWIFLGEKSIKGYPPEKREGLIYVSLQKESSRQAKNSQENTSVMLPTITPKPLQIPHACLAAYQK